ncbi:hypothetical protein BH18ACT9_BH18ACT9_22130 [soil metagenome]
MAPSPAATRLRYRRLAAFGSAVSVTLVAVLGGAGLLPEQTATRPVAHSATLSGAQVKSSYPVEPSPQSGQIDARVVPQSQERFTRADTVRSNQAARALETPRNSGAGRRVVFDVGAQRVWLVASSGAVRRTYPVSGSIYDNLDPGSYEVYSRSERAWGIDDSGTMRYMVRFAHGERAAIGFHDIPVDDGRLVQSRADLGVPRSHGCIRQWRPDARALWDFAPVGTPVVVVA